MRLVKENVVRYADDEKKIKDYQSKGFVEDAEPGEKKKPKDKDAEK